MYSKIETKKEKQLQPKAKNTCVSKHIHPPEKQEKEKNGIVDNILSWKQNMKPEGTEDNVNEETRKNVSKVMCCEERERNGSEDTRHR